MTSMDPALHELFEGGAPEEEVAAVIRLRKRATVPTGVRVVAQFGEIVTCRLRREDIPSVRADENVLSMKGPRLFTPDEEFDSGVFEDFGAEARETDERRPPDVSADGRGVVIGVIDWGVDFAHPDFINDDGTTRLLAFWDQRTRPEAAAPSPYGYGEVFSAASINRALKSRDPYAALGYHPADADADRTGTHGTHVLGIAAGNGRGGGPEGVAPAAELVFVHLSMWGKGEQDRIGDSVTIVEALDFVARTAGERPWVVNMSLGRHAGPHDGSTLVEMALDAAVTAAHGRAVVQSAGNYFDRRAHSSGQLRPGESRTLGWKTDVADTTPNELDVWYPGQDHISVEVRAPDGTTSSRVELGGRDSLNFGGREVCKIYNRAEDPNNQHNHIDIFVYPGGPAGEWEVTLFGEDVVDGRFHAWIERDAACYHCQSHFDPRDAVTSTTTGTLCNGFRNVAVGAYNAHAPEFEMAPFSSGGPTRDGRIKPDLVAPGVYVLSARSAPRHRHPEDSLYTRKSGTSMAAPHVTGTVALMFEVATRPLRIRDTRKLLMTSTRSVPGTADLIVRVGSGVLDTARAVELTRRFYEEHQRPHAPKHHAERGTRAHGRRIASGETVPSVSEAATGAEGFESRAPALIGAGAVEAMRGLSELLPGYGQCEFVRPGDMLSTSSFVQEAYESNDTHGAEDMNDEQEGAHSGCGCESGVEAEAEDTITEDDFAEDDFAEDDFESDESAEETKKRNFILISGGPGLFHTRDVEHDRSWASYVTPPLLKKKFWTDEEEVWWFVYKPAYERRWTDDENKKRKSVDEVKKKGATSYVDLIEKRAREKGWNLRWITKAAEIWTKIGTFREKSISRVWYWGHARNDLWLTIRHDSTSGEAIEPVESAVVKIFDISKSLRKHFQKGDKSRVHRFVGCNTRAFAKAWAWAYAVWAEGVVDKVNFAAIHETGGEPCLMKSAVVRYYTPEGKAPSDRPPSPYKRCKDLKGNFGEGLDFESYEDAESEHEQVPAFTVETESVGAFYADEYFGGYTSDESDESDESVYESDFSSEISPSYTSYTPSLVELADAAVSGGGAVSPGHVLNEMFDTRGYGATLNPLGSGRALSPSVIYDAFTPAGSTALREHFENVFEVIGAPRQSFATELRPGDVLIRRGEGGLGHLSVIAAPGLWHLEQLNSAGLRPEGLRAGLYAHVVEGGAFPHTSDDGFARLVADPGGRVPRNQLLLRPKHSAHESHFLEAATPSSSPSVMPMPAPTRQDEIRDRPGLTVVDENGEPLDDGDYVFIQGRVVERGSFSQQRRGRAYLGKIDPAQPFVFEVPDRVCCIRLGAFLNPDNPAIEYGGTWFDWTLVRDDKQPDVSFWPHYQREMDTIFQQEELGTGPSQRVDRFLQHEHITRRPIQIAKPFLTQLSRVRLRASAPRIRVGPFVRYADHERAAVWLETLTPCMVRVRYKKSGSSQESRGYDATVRVGGRYFAVVEIDGLQEDTFYDYTIELAPLPAHVDIPDTREEFENAFPKLKNAVRESLKKQLKVASLEGNEWCTFRTLRREYRDRLRFATGSCRWYPGDREIDDSKNQPDCDENLRRTTITPNKWAMPKRSTNWGPDMLRGLGDWLLGHAKAREQWPRFLFFSGDQIYSDQIGIEHGAMLAVGRFASRVPGPPDPAATTREKLVDGAWAGRFAHRYRTYTEPDAGQLDKLGAGLGRLDAIHKCIPSIKEVIKVEPLVDRRKVIKKSYDTLSTRWGLSKTQTEPHDVRKAREALEILPTIDNLETTFEPFRSHLYHWLAGSHFTLKRNPMGRRFLSHNFVLWSIPNFEQHLPVVSDKQSVVVAKTPDGRGHPSAEGGRHAADFAEYAYLYERAWATSRSVRVLLAQVPTFLMFDDHELTDDWNFDVAWVRMLHNRRDDFLMWPKTLTDALAAYWVYQGWGNKAPSKWKKNDPRVKALDDARGRGVDALPELRRRIFRACYSEVPTDAPKTVFQTGLSLDWHYQLPFNPPFLVPDCRSRKKLVATDDDIRVIDHTSSSKAPQSQTIDDEQLKWMRKVLVEDRPRGPVAFIGASTPLLMQDKLMQFMLKPEIAASAWAQGAAVGSFLAALLDATWLVGGSNAMLRVFRRGRDLEHMIRDRSWRDLWRLVKEMHDTGSRVKSLVLVSGDVHHSYNMTANLSNKGRPKPEMVQITSSGLQTTIRGAAKEWIAEQLSSLPFKVGERFVAPGYMSTNERPGSDVALYENSVALVDVKMGSEVELEATHLTVDEKKKEQPFYAEKDFNKHIFRYTSGPDYLKRHVPPSVAHFWL
ncbi:MAG TPA: S8 family serine peptidase, partial [Pyrinomonadaceae bacterium]